MTHSELTKALTAADFSEYYSRADELRRQHHGDIVHIRAILEFSNYCARQCRYCGLNANTSTERFRMSPEDMVSAAQQAAAAGYKTIVLQSGEDRHYTTELLGDIVREIKKTGMSITLSVGELPYSALKHLRDCGADRYLLKHETADPEIYAALHPCGTLAERVDCLRNIHELGYETGSGFMVGLPKQTTETLASDILLLQELDCHMAGIGPFIASPSTPLAGLPSGNAETVRRCVALARILMPHIHLPATTSLSVVSGDNEVFSCGANVIMKKITPTSLKRMYAIYPIDITETDIPAERRQLEQKITDLGRVPL